ncbi:MAG: hypothetical protein L0Z62_50410 [Gemmataceae bacterium]|nr:hypothetical protein [Gemmataceae bacterium]
MVWHTPDPVLAGGLLLVLVVLYRAICRSHDLPPQVQSLAWEVVLLLGLMALVALGERDLVLPIVVGAAFAVTGGVLLRHSPRLFAVGAVVVAGVLVVVAMGWLMRRHAEGTLSVTDTGVPQGVVVGGVALLLLALRDMVVHWARVYRALRRPRSPVPESPPTLGSQPTLGPQAAAGERQRALPWLGTGLIAVALVYVAIYLLWSRERPSAWDWVTRELLERAEPGVRERRDLHK